MSLLYPSFLWPCKNIFVVRVRIELVVGALEETHLHEFYLENGICSYLPGQALQVRIDTLFWTRRNITLSADEIGLELDNGINENESMSPINYSVPFPVEITMDLKPPSSIDQYISLSSLPPEIRNVIYELSIPVRSVKNRS